MHNDLDCNDLLGSLAEYIDGEARQEVCRAIEAHLAECPNCRVVVDTLKKTIYLVHATAEAETHLPGDVRQRLYKSLNLEEFLNR